LDHTKLRYMKRIVVILGLILLVIVAIKAQSDTLWLMNGKKLPISGFSPGSDTSDPLNQAIFYQTLKGKTRKVYIDEIFSVNSSSSGETVFYKPQPELGEPLDINQMRQYVTGLHLAHQKKTNELLLAGSFVSGMIGAFTPSPDIQLGGVEASLPLGFLIPISYVSLTGYFTPGKKYINSAMLPANNEYLRMGFEEGSQRKAIHKTLLAGCLGYLSGMLMVTVISGTP